MDRTRERKTIQRRLHAEARPPRRTGFCRLIPAPVAAFVIVQPDEMFSTGGVDLRGQ